MSDENNKEVTSKPEAIAENTPKTELTDKDLEQVTGGDSASPKLYEACCSGKHISKVTIVVNGPYGPSLTNPDASCRK